MEQSVPVITSINENFREITENPLEIGTSKYNQLKNEQRMIVVRVLNAARNERNSCSGTNCFFVKVKVFQAKHYYMKLYIIH